MTKEEILEGKDKYSWECDESEHVIPYSDAEKAMDVYAKQQAIAFVKWALESDKIHGDNWGDAFMPGDEEDVYNQFIEQQNKDNG